MSMLVKLAAAAALAIGFMVGGAVAPAQATTLTFSNFTNNDKSDPPLDIASQLTVTVINLGGGQVGFRFENTAVEPSVVTRILIGDSGGLFVADSASIFNQHPDVTFKIVSPKPGDGQEYGFTTTDKADADTPPPHKGLRHEDHWVTIAFNLAGTNTYNHVIAALTIGADDPLHIGLHVQSIGGENGFSDKFNVKPIPLPAGLVLFLSGLLGIGVLGRYKAKRREAAAA